MKKNVYLYLLALFRETVILLGFSEGWYVAYDGMSNFSKLTQL